VKRAGAFLAGAAVLAVTHLAEAEVSMTAAPIFGDDALPGDHWSAVVVRLDSSEAQVIRGTLEVSAASAMPGAGPPETSTAPFSLAASASAVLRIPTHAVAGWELTVIARDATGKPLATQTVRAMSGRPGPVIVDVAQPSRLGVLRGAKLTARRDGPTTMSLGVGAVTVDPATGDPMLPEHAAEYASATAVVIPSDLLARLGATELDALATWVIGGGSLAIAVKRPEDLRGPVISSFIGGEARDAGPARHLGELRSPALSRDPHGATPAPVFDPDDPFSDPPPPPPPVAKPEKKELAPVAPQQSTREALHAYEGGNLVKTDYGASAPYGLGEVHLLPFDPSAPGVLDDPWAGSRLVDLTRHAWDRRASVAMPLGVGAGGRSHTTEVRRQLDPNEASKWATAIAAVLLLAYAAVAGPLNFVMATRAGTPLRALRILPVLSVLTFFAIVGVGVVSKGVRGESRRLSLIETSGGMTRGAVRRYRGLFTPRSAGLSVQATDQAAVLGLALSGGERARLVTERAGLRVENVAMRPWETVVVREDGGAALGGGITLAQAPGDDVRVVNRTGRDLRGVVVLIPKRGFYGLNKLKDGEAVLASSGRVLGPPPTPPGPTGRLTVHGLGVSTLRPTFDAAADGLIEAWEAMEAASRDTPSVDWWPAGVPGLVAQIDGGDGVTSDAGLRLGHDRLLVRVLGWGGNP
jgi:hypothetical protein